MHKLVNQIISNEGKQMKIYTAPLEGVNLAPYRKFQEEQFGGIDKHFAPFLSPNDGVRFKKKQLVDILPEHNVNMNVVPQILTNRSADFINVAHDLEELGYKEVNLNLGCPSGTVVSKGRGSGFLYYPELLGEFLSEIFEQVNIDISVKTRLGKEDPQEFHKILEIYNKFNMKELIIHPRIQKDFYKNPSRLDFFAEIVDESRNKVCYNGDIFTPSDYHIITERFPQIDSIMLGRGVIANPALAREIKIGNALTKEELKRFHDLVYEYNLEKQCGNTNVLYRMKEYWYYMNHVFPESKKQWKKIKKAVRLDTYEEAVKEMFALPGDLEYFSPYRD